MEYILLIFGIIILVAGGELLIRSAIALNNQFDLSPLLIGTTVVAFGTSAPELIVSIQASVSGNSDIAIGNVIGSNIANIGLVLGFLLLFKSIVINKKKYRMSYLVMFIASVLFVLLSLDGSIGLFDGIVLVFGLILFLILSFQGMKKVFTNEAVIQKIEVPKQLQLKLPVYEIVLCFVLGSIGLFIGSLLLVENAEIIAYNFGVSQYIIGVSVVALGTSLPELVTSIIAIIKGHNSISIGNIIGSNIFNIFAVLGISSIINPIRVDFFLYYVDMPIMIGFIVLLGLFLFMGKKIGLIEGLALLIAYCSYMVFNFV